MMRFAGKPNARFTRSSRTLKVALGVFSTAFAAMLLHCGSDRPPPSDGNGSWSNNHPVGGPCAVEGETTDCHAVVGQRAGFVDCFDGQQVCTNGQWGPCMGSAGGGGSVSTHAFSGGDLTGGDPSSAGGFHIESYSSPGAADAGPPCSVDPCNPYCWGFNENPPAPIAPTGCVVTVGGADAGAACVTTVSGTVYDPAGALPLPNILVFQPKGGLTPFTDNGASAQCDSCASLNTPAWNTVASAVDGTFTLPIDTSGGTTNVKVVFQSGRWRRQITIPSVTACANTPIAAGNARLPRNRSEGDIPKMAIAMGSTESIECLLVKMGVSSSEIAPYQTPTDANRVQLFQNNSAITTTPAAPAILTNLVNTPARLAEYSAILFACGAGGDVTSSPGTTAAERANVQSYTDQGGRLFIDHVPGGAFINQQLAATGWPATATFNAVSANDPCGSPPCVAKGKLLTTTTAASQLESWMSLPAVGGTATYGSPFLKVDYAKNMVTAVNAATALEWTRGESANNWSGDPNGNYTLSYSFDTPVSASVKCGRVIYNDMHVSPSRGAQGSAFPSACSAAPLTEDEKALEYMIFALTACTVGTPPIPPSVGPPPGPTNYSNTYGFSACPSGFKAQWDTFGYKASTPAGTEIKFSAQTGPDGGAGPWAPTTGSPPGIALADVPLDHPGGDTSGAPSCTVTGPSPCGNNCASTIGAPMSSACPATCSCPIDLFKTLSASPGSIATAQQPELQINALLTPSAGSCAGALSPGLLTVGNNGVTTCPGAKDIEGSTCTAATQYTACDQDYHCDLTTGSPTYQHCIWNNGSSPWIDPSCVVNGKLGFDLTIEPGCTSDSGSTYNIPVCNRGGATIPAGQTINVTVTNYSSSCAKACAGPGNADCTYKLPSPLGPGQCIDIPPSASCNVGTGDRCLQVNPGNTVVDVNGNKECNGGAPGGSAAAWTTANGTGAGCNNNDTYVKGTPTCMFCGAPLQPPASPSLSSWTVTYSCVPSE